MIQDGTIILFHFPQTNLKDGKLRPALVLRKLPGLYDDWLICMISTQLSQQIEGFDTVITPQDNDFEISGLKSPSLFRLSRLAVVEESLFVGAIGNIANNRLSQIKTLLADWINNTTL